MIASLRLGGAERQLAGLACMLRQAGEDAEVLTYREGDFYSGQLKEAGVKHTFIPSRGGDAGLVRDIAAHLKATGCEVLVSFLVGTNIKACLVKRRLPGLKLIVSERNCNSACMLHDRLRFALYGRYAWKVVCNSYSQTAFVRKHAPSLAGRLYTVYRIMRPTKQYSLVRSLNPKNLFTGATIQFIAGLRPRANSLSMYSSSSVPQRK